MTNPPPDIQALIEEARAEADAQRDLYRLRSAGLMNRLAAALSALSTPTETEWAYFYAGSFFRGPFKERPRECDGLTVWSRSVAPWEVVDPTPVSEIFPGTLAALGGLTIRGEQK